MTKRMKVVIVSIMLITCMTLTGCMRLNSRVQDIKGDIVGATYTGEFYSNTGEKFMTVHGEKINMTGNVVKEYTYTGEGWGYVETLSSVVTINIDGHEMTNCGSTIIFREDGLEPDVDFVYPENIDSKAEGFGSNTSIANIVNKYSNYFGKAKVVLIQSQMGDPICAYSGDSVYWEVSADLPKTTKVMIDGHALYIHRGNFQLIDMELLK